MVYLSVQGWGNKKIGDALGYTKEHVSSILNQPEADEIRDAFLAKMRQTELENVPETLSRIAEKTASRLLTLVNSDEVFEKSPFAVIAAGMDVVKGLGHLRGGGNGAPVPMVTGGSTSITNYIGMSDELMQKMLGGLDVANQAREINKHADFTTAELASNTKPNVSGAGSNGSGN